MFRRLRVVCMQLIFAFTAGLQAPAEDEPSHQTFHDVIGLTADFEAVASGLTCACNAVVWRGAPAVV